MTVEILAVFWVRFMTKRYIHNKATPEFVSDVARNVMFMFDAGLVRDINFSLSLHPVAKEYETAVRLSQGNRSESGRCWM